MSLFTIHRSIAHWHGIPTQNICHRIVLYEGLAAFLLTDPTCLSLQYVLYLMPVANIQYFQIDRQVYKRKTITLQHLMTTLTNFLHSSFLSTSPTSDSSSASERPIWVLNGNQSNKINAIKEYIVDNCVGANQKQYQKVLVRVDFGIGVRRELRNGCTRLQSVHGLEIWVKDGAAYLLVCVRAELRNNTSKCLSLVMEVLSKIANKLPTYIESVTQKTALSLLIQNLQIISSWCVGQQGSSPNLQSFITHIPSLPACYKQTTIITYSMPGLLLPEHIFALERICTCLTNVLVFDKAEGCWRVATTVRRYTGYSKEEKYDIHITKSGRFKVEKHTQRLQQSETETQKNMVRQLGFVVKKGLKDQQNQRNIKQMIYPHLRVQNQNKTCECGKAQCQNGCQCETVRPEDEGLIVLDDEQEDDDDIDV